jgi:hypothetical protein
MNNEPLEPEPMNNESEMTLGRRPPLSLSRSLETDPAKFAVSDGMLDVLVAEIVLQRPSIHTLIGQLEPG